MRTIPIVLLIIVSLLILANTFAKDDANTSLANCIEKEALSAHYAGDIHGAKAWETFAPLCDN